MFTAMASPRLRSEHTIRPWEVPTTPLERPLRQLSVETTTRSSKTCWAWKKPKSEISRTKGSFGSCARLDPRAPVL